MQTKRFNLFHLSLIPVRQPSFETLRDLTREQWLRTALAEQFSFPYRADEELYWVPQPSVDEFIVGIIERPRSRLQHLPPEQGGTEVEREEWQGAYVAIDPTHHDDGQKMAVEQDIVGLPGTLVKYLAKHINSRENRPYELEPAQIFDSSDYYEFLKTNGDNLKYIRFHFVVPNMWDTKRRLDKELKDTHDETGTDELDVTFKSRRGVDGSAKRITDGVEYAARGAGRVRATAQNGKKFNSENTPTQSQIELPDTLVVEREGATWIRDFTQRIMGRE